MPRDATSLRRPGRVECAASRLRKTRRLLPSQATAINEQLLMKLVGAVTLISDRLETMESSIAVLKG